MASSKMPRAIVDLDEFTEPINLMIYGDTGSGKTEMIGHLPGKVLIIASENGIGVIKRAWKRRGIDVAREKKRFKVWPIRSWADLEECYLWCRDNPGVFDWYAIDSATSLDQRAMRAAMEVAVKRNPEKRDIDLPDRGEHQKMQNAMKRMITDFNELPTNTLWLAQAMRREDQDGNEIVVPFIRGKDYEVSAFACAQMQAFGYYMKKSNKAKKGQTDRLIIWESFADPKSEINYWAKDRYQVFPRVSVMAEGEEQKMLLSDLLDLIDANSIERAANAVETRDDPEEEPAAPEDVEDDDDDANEQSLEEFRAELSRKTKAALATDVEEAGIDITTLKGATKDQIIDAIIAAYDDSEEEDAEEEAEVDDIADLDVTDTADAIDRRIDELLEMTNAQLKDAVIAAGFTVAEFKGRSRDDIAAAVAEAEFSEDDDDDDLDLEEMMDEPPAKPTRKTGSRFRATIDE